MKISDVTSYTTEPNIFKNAHAIINTRTADKNYKHGDLFPANGATAEGVVYHDTEAGQPLALIVEGHLLAFELPTQPNAAAIGALKQITFYDGNGAVLTGPTA